MSFAGAQETGHFDADCGEIWGSVHHLYAGVISQCVEFIVVTIVNFLLPSTSQPIQIYIIVEKAFRKQQDKEFRFAPSTETRIKVDAHFYRCYQAVCSMPWVVDTSPISKLTIKLMLVPFSDLLVVHPPHTHTPVAPTNIHVHTHQHTHTHMYARAHRQLLGQTYAYTRTPIHSYRCWIRTAVSLAMFCGAMAGFLGYWFDLEVERDGRLNRRDDPLNYYLIVGSVSVLLTAVELCFVYLFEFWVVSEYGAGLGHARLSLHAGRYGSERLGFVGAGFC